MWRPDASARLSYNKQRLRGKTTVSVSLMRLHTNILTAVYLQQETLKSLHASIRNFKFESEQLFNFMGLNSYLYRPSTLIKRYELLPIYFFQYVKDHQYLWNRLYRNNTSCSSDKRDRPLTPLLHITWPVFCIRFKCTSSTHQVCCPNRDRTCIDPASKAGAMTKLRYRAI